MTYDADGNLTNDGIWSYSWDGENRLIRLTTVAAASTGYPQITLTFRYDYLGRRVEKLVIDNASNRLLTGRRFLYDGWNLIAEYTLNPQLSTLSLFRSYTWGLDITRTLTDAGGVGALLQIADHRSGKTYFPAYDGNGNITALVNSSTGAVAAAYEYSPFGEPLRADAPDSVVADQPFRFSTKYTDSETGLVYYGRRYYDAGKGRFVGRDTIEEQGGLNLYAFCLNNPINLWDYLGMDPYLDRLQAEQETIQSEIQQLREKLQTLIDEAATYGRDGNYQQGVDGLNKQIEQAETQSSAVGTSIALYGGNYTVGADGDTGIYYDRNGKVGLLAFSSPTIFDRSNGAITIGTDPQTGQTWTVWRQNQGMQDMTGMFFGGVQTLLIRPRLVAAENAGAAVVKGAPKPTPNFKLPTNPAQPPPAIVPPGYTVRVMPPTQQYPNGYWRLEKPMPQGGAQGINPSTMKPGPQQDTHVPLPPGWKG